MSFGKMNTQIQITQKRVALDDEGFQTESNVVVATVRAYREGRHGSEKWANRAAFSEATDLFRFRAIPGVRISTDMRQHCRKGFAGRRRGCSRKGQKQSEIRCRFGNYKQIPFHRRT